jgi:chromosomal replication initiator protein
MNEPLAIIRDQVAKHCDVPVAAIMKPGKGTRRISHARQLGYYVSRETTGASYPAIARAFGRKGHATVFSGVSAIQRERRNPTFSAAVSSLVEHCREMLAGPA